MVDESIVKIFPTEMGVSRCRFDFKNTVFDRQHGHIKGTAAKIENQNISLCTYFFVQSVGNGSGGWFVNDTEYIQTGNGTGIFGRLKKIACGKFYSTNFGQK